MANVADGVPAKSSWVLLFVHGGLGMFFGYALRPLISTEILDGGHSSAWIGVATMVFAVPPLVLAIPAGRLLDRTGERPWLIVGSLFYFFSALLVLFSTTLDGAAGLAVLVVASGVIGLGSLTGILGQQTWVMHAAAKGRPDFWFGLYTFALTVGQLIAPSLLWLPGAADGSALATVPITVTLLGAAIVAGIAGGFVPSHDRMLRSPSRKHRGGADGRRAGSGRDSAVARSAAPPTGELDLPDASAASYTHGSGDDDPCEREEREREREHGERERDEREGMLRASMRLLRRTGVVRTLVASGLVIASIDIVIAYLPLLTRERGLDAAWIGALLVARALAGMASRLWLARLTDWFGRRAVMVTGAAIGAAALVAMALPLPPWALVVCIVIYGFAAGTVQPLTMSWMTLIAPAGERGLMTSLRMVGNRTGQTLVPLIIAGVSVVGGGALAFIVTGITLALSSFASTTAPNGDEVTRDRRSRDTRSR